MSAIALRPHLLALAPLAALALCACTADRNLKITEIGTNAVELYLDEPADHTLVLSDQVLTIKSTAPDGSSPETKTFELFGTMHGGEFLVVWEDPNYTGVPTYSDYVNFFNRNVPGIMVEAGTLGTFDNTRCYSYRVHGSRYRYIFPFFYAIDETDDVVKFGPQPRPDVGGTFHEDGSLAGVERTAAQGLTPGRTVWHRTRMVDGVEVPRDYDNEDDFREADENFGAIH